MAAFEFPLDYGKEDDSKKKLLDLARCKCALGDDTQCNIDCVLKTDNCYKQ